jgi:hypothetical protein
MSPDRGKAKRLRLIRENVPHPPIAVMMGGIVEHESKASGLAKSLISL